MRNTLRKASRVTSRSARKPKRPLPSGLPVPAVGLSPAQHRAIERMASGETTTAAAAAAGVARQTVHRWLHDDPAFRAAYNAWQLDAVTHARGRILALADIAVSTVTDAIESGDSRLAFAVLKNQGLIAPTTLGPTDVEQVARAKLFATARTEVALAEAEMAAPPEIYAPAATRAYRRARDARRAKTLPPPAAPAAASPTPADANPDPADASPPAAPEPDGP